MGMGRAPHVCTACKARKRSCDKQLPCCGYCASRNLDCSYDTGDYDYLPMDKDVANGTPFLLLDTPPHIWARNSTWKLTGTSPEQFSCISPSIEMPTLDHIMHLHVTRTLHHVGFSLRDISKQYFGGFHIWLPIVCPTHFREKPSQHILPPADSSILTLALCLITTRPPLATPKDCLHDSRASLYVFVKMLLAQGQAELCSSVPLLQASLLMSAYEYASGRPRDAYISLSSCVAMAHILRINDYEDLKAKASSAMTDGLEVREAWNVWWAIVIMQRLILIEHSENTRLPRTGFPDLKCPLPCDLEPIQDLASATLPVETATTVSLAETRPIQVSRFARQAQAVQLFEQVLRIADLKAKPEIKVLELKKVDGETQDFMSLVLNECSQGYWKIRGGVVASTQRILFALHGEILTQLSYPGMEDLRKEWAEASIAALNTVVNMFSDIVHHHMKQGETFDDTPPCCIYSLRTALTHAEQSYNASRDEKSLKQLIMVKAWEETLSQNQLSQRRKSSR